MNIDSIRSEIKDIEDMSHNPEVAHEMEDDLYTDFIQFIANSSNNEFSKLAQEVLKAKEINFRRWYC